MYINIEPLKMATGVANSRYIESQFLQIKSSRKIHKPKYCFIIFIKNPSHKTIHKIKKAAQKRISLPSSLVIVYL